MWNGRLLAYILWCEIKLQMAYSPLGCVEYLKDIPVFVGNIRRQVPSEIFVFPDLTKTLKNPSRQHNRLERPDTAPAKHTTKCFGAKKIHTSGI